MPLHAETCHITGSFCQLRRRTAEWGGTRGWGKLEVNPPTLHSLSPLRTPPPTPAPCPQTLRNPNVSLTFSPQTSRASVLVTIRSSNVTAAAAQTRGRMGHLAPGVTPDKSDEDEEFLSETICSQTNAERRPGACATWARTWPGNQVSRSGRRLFWKMHRLSSRYNIDCCHYKIPSALTPWFSLG